MNEADIIKGCLKNDRASQKQLYELYYGKMLGICLRYSKTTTEAKDILHEGFLKVFTALKTFDLHTTFENWIKKIIVTTAVDHLRRNKHNYLIVSTVNAYEKPTPIEEVVNDDAAFANIDKEELLKAVQELTPAYRTVFNLFLIDGYTHKEIAEILDISEDTSKSNLSKAKFNLKKHLTHLIKAVNKK
jgi:RNA polymerase sigma factor (sigma-70 family)